jgi:hypothetical protein
VLEGGSAVKVALAVATVVMLSAALVLFSFAIWTDDGRWAQTALLTLLPGVAAAVSLAVAKAADAL